MTRGNQRELARQKNQKKNEVKGRKPDGLTKLQRVERDKKAMEEKKARKEAGNTS
jgi:hypothetical protein